MRPCRSGCFDEPTLRHDFEQRQFLRVDKVLKRGATRDHKGRALYSNQVSYLKITQCARNRLTSGADKFRNFFVRQRQLDPRALFRLLDSFRPGEQETREFFLRGS